MIKIICLMLCLFTAAPAWAGGTDWTTTDTVMQVVFTALLEVDREQTHWIADHPRELIYTTTQQNGRTVPYVDIKVRTDYNPIIGRNASPARINTYFGAVAVGHAAVSYALRKSGWTVWGVPAVTVWQSVTITAEAANNVRNASLGVKMSF